MTAFNLEVLPDPANLLVNLRLRAQSGEHLVTHQVMLRHHADSLWEGLFDTRAHVGRYRGMAAVDGRPVRVADELTLEKLGVFLGEHVLGVELLGRLSKGNAQRTLIVHLPDPTNDTLAAAFARVPWEIARAKLGDKPLAELNLVVRAVPADVAAVTADGGGGELRVLLVFAEAPGSSPLAMRQERERLMRLFYDEIMPSCRVRVDVLCHAVTRSRLRDRVQAARGYDVVHWSGHGHKNLLELAGEAGGADKITGEELADLFREAGGFVPRLVFLSACLSGAFIQITDWASLRAVIRGEAATRGEASANAGLAEVLQEQPGYTGSALALLRAGVAQVVAMRYEVSDDYALNLAERFYVHLLADEGRHPADAALALARGDLARKEERDKYVPVDHATPLIFGWANVEFALTHERSAQLDKRDPEPQPLLTGGKRDLDARTDFVGRSAELTRLNTTWLPRGGKAVALVQGLAGLGKTSLAAEAVHLWHGAFDWVLAFQSRPTAVTAESFYRGIEERLALVSKVHRDTCKRRPDLKVYQPSADGFVGEARYDLLRNNLMQALGRERILVVIDNFETNLLPPGWPEGYACEDPEWDAILKALADGLGRTKSRLLMTCRHRVAALADEAKTLWLPLGPLPLPEAALFLKSNEGLRALVFGDEEGQKLAKRALEVSRGHPLIMERMASLSGDRVAMAKALETLTAVGGMTKLPDVFVGATTRGDKEAERRYLADVAVGAIDLLIERASESARRLLWLASLANEPSTEEMLAGVWSGRTLEQERMRGEASKQAEPVAPLLRELREAGLLSVEPGGFGCHELVRERVDAWLESRPRERGERTREQVWQEYGVRYAASFHKLRSSGKEETQDKADEAGRRAFVYVILARDFDALRGVASQLVTGTRDPGLLESIAIQLRSIADQLPAGRMQWKSRAYLADACTLAHREEQALPLYEQAAGEAEVAENWADLGWICHNWANALKRLGRFGAARQAYKRCAESDVKAGSPQVSFLGSELELLRLDVKEGEAERALPEILQKLEEVRSWWQRHRRGEKVFEVPYSTYLRRVFVGALEIAAEATRVLHRWHDSLDLLEELEQVQESLGASHLERVICQHQRAAPLLELGRMVEAQQVLEECLRVYRDFGDLSGQVGVLSDLASLWQQRDDIGFAVSLGRQVLSVRERLGNPGHIAIAHHNLGNYLLLAGQKSEGARHQLVALAYSVVLGSWQFLSDALATLHFHRSNAASAGESYDLPRIVDVLALNEFESLRRFLEERGAATGELQTELTSIFAQVRAYLEQSEDASPDE